MLKKISITFVLTMVFAIAALFVATQVLAQTPTPETPTPEIKKTGQGSYFEFVDADGKIHYVSYRTNRNGDKIQDLTVDGNNFKDHTRDLSEFRFCDKADDGNVTIDKVQYFCHEPKVATNEAGFIGNPGSCPMFLNPPGIWFDPCKLFKAQ